MIDVMPLLKYLNSVEGQVSDMEHLLAAGFSKTVIDHCLEKRFVSLRLCVIMLEKEGMDQLVFDDIVGDNAG